MAHARYDVVADFYVQGFDSADDPASLASFVFSILHPCFAGGEGISGSWPATGSYYDEGRWTPGAARSTLRRQVGANHRKLSTYLGVLRRHGLWLDQLAEPLPEPGWDQAHDADRNPVYLVARSVKPSAT